MPKTPAVKRKPARKAALNPLLVPWRTKFAMPPFERIAPRDFGPAFAAGLKAHKSEIGAIASDTARPTYANTLLALERSGRALNRVADVFFNLAGAHTNPELQDVERKIAPKLADHSSAIYLNKKLFKRINTLFLAREALKLDTEQLRLLEVTHRAFVRAGANLDAKAKKRIAEINSRLATLTTSFAQNVLADEQAWHLILEGEGDLAGLPDGVRAAAKQVAKDLGHEGKHAITLSRSSVECFLQFSARRDLREEAFKAWVKRGENAGKTDNRILAAEIIALRTETAQLMGYRTYAEYSLEDTMAHTPSAVGDLLNRIWPAAVGRAGEESEALAQLARSEGGNFRIEPWDWRYYAEKRRKADYDLDDAELRPYFQLERMIEAAFDTASRLFGLKFFERTDLPRYHPDVRAWEVSTRSGDPVGLFLGDYFARPSKRSGAWMSSYRSQHRLSGDVKPIIVNVMNFARGSDDAPTLLSFDDARTLFHEFGHGLHGLLSDVTYPSLSGTNVVRDYVELPSQLYEHWLTRPEVLKRFAIHATTGKPIPDRLLERLKATRTFNQGFSTVEYTASALVDMELHALESTGPIDVSRFERETLDRLGMPSQIVMRHRIPHFLHIMGGYAAGYYSYLWSEVMDADAFEAFEEAGDIFDRKTAKRLYEFIYSGGNKRDPQDAYVAFRGREPRIEGLLKKRGFAT